MEKTNSPRQNNQNRWHTKQLSNPRTGPSQTTIRESKILSNETEKEKVKKRFWVFKTSARKILTLI